MAYDVSQATLETVFRISIGKLRVLHNSAQPSVNTQVLRTSQLKDISASQRTVGSPRTTPPTASTANRLLRSLLITRLARKVRSQLMVQQTETRGTPECTTATDTTVTSTTCVDNQSDPTSPESSTSECNMNSDSPCFPDTPFTTDSHSDMTSNRKRLSPPEDCTDHIAAKLPCSRTDFVHPVESQVHNSDVAKENRHDPAPHSPSAPERRSRKTDHPLRDLSPVDRIPDPTTVPRLVMNSRVSQVVVTVTSPEQSDVCHIQPSNTVAHLATLPYRLLPGVS
ncbi:unnamed protein product [Echinostoma caproni]|uniref:Uncharacterized protein n=1 Tax=Echinostoma caproni TaxID=27848 RepID=A0A183ACN9_9TREM|nr:unnamed protein product [Echinostoma caproni]